MLSLLASLIPSAVNVGMSIYNKSNQPKVDFSNEMGILDKFIANNRGDIAGKTLYHTLSRPQIRQAALQREQTQRNLEGMYNRGNIGEGGLAQANISSGAEFGRTVADISDRAMSQQIQSNIQKQDKIQEAQMQLAKLKDSQKNQNAQMNAQANTNIFQSLGQLGGQLSTVFQGISDEKFSNSLSNIIKTETEKGTSFDAIMDMVMAQILAGGK